MTTPLTENPAVVDPMRTLSSRQRDAMFAIDFYRHQRIDGGYWQIGYKKYSTRLINTLIAQKVVQQRGHSLSLTIGGKIAADKLKRGGRHGTA